MEEFDAIVSGGDGFLWRYLLLPPLSSEFRLCFVGRQPPGPDVHFEFIDLSSPNAATILEKKSLGCRAFVHFAAPTPGSSAATMLTETIALAENSAAIARASGAKVFIHASSGAVYGSDWPGRKTESDAPHPITDYGLAKRSAEEIIDARFISSARGSTTAHLRLHFPTPPILALVKAAKEGQSARLFARMVHKVLAGETIQLDEVEFRFNPCPGLALITLLRTAINGENDLPRVINVAGAFQVTIEDIVLQIGLLLGRTPILTRKRGPARSMLADVTLFRTIVNDAVNAPLF